MVATVEVSRFDVCQAPSTVSETVHQRLDALDARLSWFYIRILLLTGVSWAVHAAELVLFALTRHFVAHDVGMGTYALEALGVGVFLGAALGGPLFGHFADARGRRSALLLAMTVSFVGLALSAVAKKDYHVIVARIVAGVGLGGELPAATVLVQELAPNSMRGRMVALLEAFTGLGGVVGVVLAFGVAPQLGWRNTYLAICGCVLYVGVLRVGIPESPRWLASVARVDEALDAVENLERAHGKQAQYDNLKGTDAPTPVAIQIKLPVANGKSSAFEKPVQTLVLWTMWSVMAVSSYALGVYVPTLISLFGFNMYESWSTIALLHASQVVGCVVASAVVETRGRKQTMAFFATFASVVSVLLSYMPWYQTVVMVGTCSVSALLAGTWSCLLAYSPEGYTTGVRARGVSYAFGFSRLSAAGGALLYPYMFDVLLMSVPVITWIFAGVLAATALGVVMPYGFDPSANGYSTELSGSSARDSGTDLVEPEDEENLLVINADRQQAVFELQKLKKIIDEPEREASSRSEHLQD